MPFIHDLQVRYGDEPSQEPGGTVTDIHGGGNDINKGFGGKYVWLVPSYAQDQWHALTSFDIAVQEHADESKQDLAKGAGGEYRYVIPLAEQDVPEKISEVRLLRSSNRVDSIPSGYNGMTGDINRGRKGDYLYIIWKTQTVEL